MNQGFFFQPIALSVITSVGMCTVCSNLKFVFDEESGAASREGEIGWKVSCCGKCSNPACPDHGECTCFDEQMDRRMDFLRQQLERGWRPSPPDED